METVIQIPRSSLPAPFTRSSGLLRYETFGLFLEEQHVAWAYIMTSDVKSPKVLEELLKIIKMTDEPIYIPAREIEIGNQKITLSESYQRSWFEHIDDYHGGVLREFAKTYLFFPTKSAWELALVRVDELRIVLAKVINDVVTPLPPSPSSPDME